MGPQAGGEALGAGEDVEMGLGGGKGLNHRSLQAGCSGTGGGFSEACVLGSSCVCRAQGGWTGAPSREERESPSRESKTHDSASAAVQEGNDRSCSGEWGWNGETIWSFPGCGVGWGNLG